MKSSTIRYILQIIVAVILLQTLYFKFTAHPDSVHIFSAIHMEPWGRIGSGIAELILGLILLIPRPKTAFLGALGSIGIISGAIYFHLTKLGVVVKNDGGMLFGLAVAVFVGSVLILMVGKFGKK